MQSRPLPIFRALRRFVSFNPHSHNTPAFAFEKHAESSHGDAPFLLFEDQVFSYAEANRWVNQYAHAYKELGLRKNDVIALVMENRPEFLWHYLAAGKLGIVISLINTHNSGAPLLHSLRVCEPKAIVIGAEIWPGFANIREELAFSGSVFLAGEASDSEETLNSILADAPDKSQIDIWQHHIQHQSTENPPETATHQLDDIGVNIYTSGTTGLPKAAPLRYSKLFGGDVMFGVLCLRLKRGDVTYNCLPLYHSSALAICTSSVIYEGTTLALARRFSTSRFWDDVRKFNANAFVYIGELCRYLMNAPASDDDRDNPVRAIVGNGLRPDIWEAFQERFGIEQVFEFYGATEANLSAVNLFNKVGSVGRVFGPGSALVRWDDDKQDFVRDDKGFLVKCDTNETGVLIGAITKMAKFDGYQDAAATHSKILSDVFKPGDRYFNTGDLLRADEKKNLYFVDRLGDTYRWKGENISTFEVQEQISSWPMTEEVNVYGVKIEGTEGRAGMASIVLKQGTEFSPEQFQSHIDQHLTSYTRPLFVRVSHGLETTGTFKLKKVDLVREGFDPDKVPDPIYFRHPEHNAYIRMTHQHYQDLLEGKLRV